MKEHYEAIKKGLSLLDQSSLFGGQSDRELVEACVAFIREKGYGVRKSDRPTFSSIKKTDDLIAYFYGRMRKEQSKETVYENLGRDRKIAKVFITGRMEAEGVNEATALQSCAHIVKTVLDNYSEYNFKYAINFSIFGSANLSWVTQKAIDIINSKNKIKMEREHKTQLDLMTQKAAKDTPMGYDDLDALLEQIEEENNGSKKEND